METRDVHELSERFTVLSDRFRSLWTFFQFLAGVYKHRGEGQIPYQYDFHALYKRIQDLVPNIRGEISKLILVEFEQIERELERIQRNLESLDGSFPPSYLRRFFDHLKRQDEKILFALVKFYLMSQELDQETLDKLDILLTRLAEVPAENGELMHRSPSELLPTYKRLAKFAGLTPLPSAEEKPYVEGMAQIREEFDRIGDFDTLVQSKIYDRLRGFKTRIGRDMLHPAILVEVTAANIAARNRFRELFEIEERQLRDGTNRILEIERYLEKNPGLASENIKQKIEAFRRSQLRFEKGLRQDNVKRSDILELRQSMHAVLAQFEATAADPLGDFEDPPPPSVMLRVPRWSDASAGDESAPSARDTSAEAPTLITESGETPVTSITDVLPNDPLLNEVLHKIMFALEMVVWDRSPEQVVQAPEIKSLGLEPWEVETYRTLVEQQASAQDKDREVERFFLTSAALRVKMEEERREIQRLAESSKPDHLATVLENSASSLDRAREVDQRFLWFIDDMIYRAETDRLTQIYRSRFRFLSAYAGLWLDHQKHGGLTPL